jgi:ribosomal protein L15
VSVGVSPRRREKISGHSSAASSASAVGRGGGYAGRGRGKTGGRGPKHKADASVLMVTGAFTPSYHTETAATQTKCFL